MSVDLATGPPAPVESRPRTSVTAVRSRRIVGAAALVTPVALAVWWALRGDAALVNPGGIEVLGRLASAIVHPELSAEFLGIVWHATLVTLGFAALGTALALAIGVVGGAVLSDAAWSSRPGPILGFTRWCLRGILVAARAIHEIIWALLLVSVLGLDPLAGVLALGIPFGAQTAKVFADTLDNVDQRPLRALRGSGVSGVRAVAYGLLPSSMPFLVSYSFYRFECSVRSAVVLGVVGVGGLGEELAVSLQSRNWNEVWTLIYAVLVVSALVEAWSARIRGDLAVATCADWRSGALDVGRSRRAASPRWVRWSLGAMAIGLIGAWFTSGVSLSGLFSERTRNLGGELIADSWPPALPNGGWTTLGEAVADSVAMAVLAMVIAIVVTLGLSPLAMRSRLTLGQAPRGLVHHVRGVAVRAWSRASLLVLRSVPPTVWAVVALLLLYPGVAPGALALGLYTGGILGRLVTEAWEGIDLRPRDALRHIGTSQKLAAVAAMMPPSAAQLTTYGLYRFEICVRDTAIVGVVGAAGLGRLIGENMAFFRLDVVAGLLLASVAISVGAELLGRAARRSLTLAGR